MSEELNNEIDYDAFEKEMRLAAMGIKTLKTIDAQSLMSKKIPPKEFFISGLLPQGLSVLGGPSKTGKSWMALWFGVQLASGQPIWNFETKPCKVLYLALEDDESRLQSRLFDITEDAPPGLLLATRASTLDDGFIERLEYYLQEEPDIKVIIVDTLQKIRGGQSPSSNVYAQDYRDMGLLKSFADNHRLAILLVHHLRKLGDSDPINKLSGSSGIAGASDTIMILERDKRTSNAATLFITGRDVNSSELRLVFDEESHCWLTTEGNAELVKLIDPTIDLVADYLQSLAFETLEISATELSERLREYCGTVLHPPVISKQLICHHEQLSVRGFEFKLKRKHGGCKLIISHAQALESVTA